MGMKIENDNEFIDNHEAYGNRELKFYKDIYGNEVRLLTTREKKLINNTLIIAIVFVVILISGFFYKAYLINKEVEERTKLYMVSGDSLDDGKQIVENGGVILSENTDIVDVDNDGTIVAKNSGTTNVTIYKNLDVNNFTSKIKNKKDKTIYQMYDELGIEGEFTVEVTVKQKVNGVKVNINSINMFVGETDKLTANVYPETAHNKDVKWSSSDNDIVSVDNNGVITAKKSGVITITANTKDGNYKDSTVVNVFKRENENKIFLALDDTDLKVNDKVGLKVVVSPNKELISKVEYSSSDNSVASINSNGLIIAKKPGIAKIKASIKSLGISSVIDIKVSERVIEKIYLSSNNLNLTVDDTVVLKSYFYPSELSDFVSYTSSDNSVVSVNSNGKVKALREGKAVIVVKSSNGVLANCNVVVKNGIVKASGLTVSLEKENIGVGENTYVISSVKPDIANKNLTYVSSDYSVAMVDNNGVVTGINPGKAVIFVTTASGVSDSISVNVSKSTIKLTKLSTTDNLIIKTGESSIIDVNYEPSKYSVDIDWFSSDNNIAIVDSNGFVTGVNEGRAVITARVGDISSKTIVDVNRVGVEKVELNYNEVNLFIKQNIDLDSFVFPVNATNNKVVWSTSNNEIAKVNSKGVVTALKEGSVVIRATSVNNNKIYVECKVNVSKIDVESFELSHRQVIISGGETVKLSIDNFAPSNASYKNAIFEVEDTSIARVDKNGVVTGVKSGKTNINVYVDGIVKKLDLTVLDKGDKVYFIDTYIKSNVPSDAILLESNGKYAMIDTGSPVASMDVIKFLKDLGVDRLEFILITHFHSSSFGGIYGELESNNILLSDIDVGKIYMKPYSASDSYFKDNDDNVITSIVEITDRRKVRSSMFTSIRENAIINNISYTPIDYSFSKLSFGNFEFNFYNTKDQLKTFSSSCLKNYNCSEDINSVVSYVTVNGKSLYLSGDIMNAYHDKKSKYLKDKTEISIAKQVFENSNQGADIYKVSNYGYGVSNSDGALEKINPRYSVVTNSIRSFNLKDKNIKRIDEYTSKDIYYSGDGTVVLNINKDGNMNFIQLND